MKKKAVSTRHQLRLKALAASLAKERDELFEENQKLWETIKASEQVGEDCARCWYNLMELLKITRTHMARLDVPRPKIRRPSKH
jgi:bacterioferritin-associated ferredoxin